MLITYQIDLWILCFQLSQEIDLLIWSKWFQREKLAIRNEASQLVYIVEHNARTIGFINVVYKELATQDTCLGMLHSILPHSIGHSTTKYLCQRWQIKKFVEINTWKNWTREEWYGCLWTKNVEFLHFLTFVAHEQEDVGNLLQLQFLPESIFCEVHHP